MPLPGFRLVQSKRTEKTSDHEFQVIHPPSKSEHLFRHRWRLGRRVIFFKFFASVASADVKEFPVINRGGFL